MRCASPFIRSLLLAVVLALAAQSASAIVTVGPDTGPTGCRFRTIQEAIDYVLGYERFHPDEVDPYIGVAGDRFYNEALVIDKPVLELLNINPETPLEVKTDGHTLIVSPATSPERRAKFEAALKKTNRKFGKALKRLAK